MTQMIVTDCDEGFYIILDYDLIGIYYKDPLIPTKISRGIVILINMHFKSALEINALSLAYITAPTVSKEYISKLHLDNITVFTGRHKDECFPKHPSMTAGRISTAKDHLADPNSSANEK